MSRQWCHKANLRHQLSGLIFLLSLLFAVLSTSAFAVVEIARKPYLSVNEIADTLKMRFAWAKPQKEVRLDNEWTHMHFIVNKRYAMVNGTKVYLGNPVATHGGRLHISQKDYNLTILPILQPQRFSNVPKLYRIVIDPGHGGKDHGASSNGLIEKQVALDVSNRLKQKLEQRGYKVDLTRTVDKKVPLTLRPQIANRERADLFISIHCNSAGNTSARGIESYILTLKDQPSSNRHKLVSADRRSYPGNRNDPWNALIGYHIQHRLVAKDGVKDRGLKRARFAVLEDLKCPGVLVECGFISNKAEAANLKRNSYINTLVQSITDGVVGYQTTLNRIRSKTAK